MANNSWDAAIKQLYPADDGTKDFAETVKKGDAFDVVASIEIGRNLMQFVDGDTLYVTVSNLSRMEVVTRERKQRVIKPEDKTRTEDLTVDIKSGWTADVGDVLQVVATYTAEAGLHTDFSATTSELFVVVPA